MIVRTAVNICVVGVILYSNISCGRVCSPDLPEPEQYWCTDCPKPAPWQKYCTLGVVDDMDFRHYFMSSICIDGGWQCCRYLSHPPSDPEEFQSWYEEATMRSASCPLRKPWEEICLWSATPDPCDFDPCDICGNYGDNNEHPSPSGFDEWKRKCLIGNACY